MQKSVLNAADVLPGQTERLYDPRIVISVTMEMNEALAEN